MTQLKKKLLKKRKTIPPKFGIKENNPCYSRLFGYVSMVRSRELGLTMLPIQIVHESVQLLKGQTNDEYIRSILF